MKVCFQQEKSNNVLSSFSSENISLQAWKICYLEYSRLVSSKKHHLRYIYQSGKRKWKGVKSLPTTPPSASPTAAILLKQLFSLAIFQQLFFFVFENFSDNFFAVCFCRKIILRLSSPLLKFFISLETKANNSDRPHIEPV